MPEPATVTENMKTEETKEDVTEAPLRRGLMPAGTYFVGDLNAVLDDERWDAIRKTMSKDDSEDGFYEMPDDKMRFYYFDGDFQGDDGTKDTDGRRYHYLGAVGCVETKYIKDLSVLKKPEDDEDWEPPGHIIEFPNKFTCGSREGTAIWFGKNRVVFNLRGCDCEPYCRGKKLCAKNECDECCEVGCHGECLVEEMRDTNKRMRRERLRENGMTVVSLCEPGCECGDKKKEEGDESESEEEEDEKKKQKQTQDDEEEEEESEEEEEEDE
jgi:hypothetical protein